MKRILTVTTGTRDVQLRQTSDDQGNTSVFEYSVPEGENRSVKVKPHDDHPGMLLLSSMRNGCLQLAKDYSLIRENLVMPLIEPAVKYVLENGGNIDLLLFVVTNQEKESVPVRFKEKDTVNLPALAEKYLSGKFPGRISAFDTYEVYEKATDIDLWYDRFEDDFRKKILIEESEGEAEVWFMPQGGLDQVNQALTLRFIEHWQALKLMQVAENSEPRLLEFPGKFLRNVTKVKAIEMAKYFRFSEVLSLNLSHNTDIALLAELGNTLMRLDYSTLVSMSSKEPWLSAMKEIPVVRSIFETWVEKPDAYRMNMWLYLTARVNAYCGNTEELLWRLFALYEQILKPYVAKKINWGNVSEEHPFNTFNACIERNRDLLEYLRNNNLKQKVLIPGASAFNHIVKFYNVGIPENVRIINKILSSLKENRNMLVHQGRGISMKKLNGVLSEFNKDLEEFFARDLDPYFGVEGFGVLGELRDDIITRL